MPTDQYERDFEEFNAKLRFNGRFDPRLLQNLDDAGDGYPGLQKAIRNWHNNNKFETSDYDIYDCSTQAEIVSALTAIGSGQGIIRLYGGTITLSSTINIDGGGSYIIQGQGDKSVIDLGGNWLGISITAATSCVLRDFKIDAQDLTTSINSVIRVDEISDNPIKIDNITILGDGTNGFGIEVKSENVVINGCNIDSVGIGINLVAGPSVANHCIVTNNIVKNTYDSGIEVDGSFHNISNNYIESCDVGINMTGIGNHIIQGNIITDCTLIAIYMSEIINSVISDNVCNLNNLSSVSNGGGIFLASLCDNNTISGNICNGNVNAGAGDGHGIIINNANCDNNTVMANTCLNNDAGFNYVDSGTGTEIGGLLPFEHADNDISYEATFLEFTTAYMAMSPSETKTTYFQYVIPEDFHSFQGNSDDISVRAVQSAGADIDTTITLDFYDASGTDSDDDSISSITLTGSIVTYDCAIDAGSFSPGDKVIIKVAIYFPDTDDHVKYSIPKIKYV